MSDFLKKESKPIDVQDLSLASKTQKSTVALANQLGAGVYHTELREGLPLYDDAPCEKYIQGDNNSHIILGRDRPYSKGSGKGAFGGKCGRIHLIAGLAAASDLNDGVLTGPNLITDAATVYISQRTSIDEYFGIPAGTNMSANDKSGIGIKADHVRIIGREHVKIYAGSAQNIAKPNKPIRNVLGLNRERNSKGGDIISRGRIDLIADNYNDIQPAVKGNNLQEYLSNMNDLISRLVAEINQINRRNMKLNNALLLAPIPSLGLSFQILAQMPGQFKTSTNTVIENLNLMIEEINYISTDLPVDGARNILSDSVYIT